MVTPGRSTQDTLTIRLAENYRAQSSLATTQVAKDDFKKSFVLNIAQSIPDQTEAYNAIVRLGQAVDEDLTIWHPSQKLDVPSPIPADLARKTLTDAAEASPIWRKALAKAVGGAQWWQENLTEPGAALAMATMMGLVPGEQTFERKMREAAIERAHAAGGNARTTIWDVSRDATVAWRKTDSQWGFKGFMELIFDPTNLIGLGVPGLGANLARKAGLRAFIKPLQVLNAIDNAPNAAVNKLLTLPGKGLIKIPVVKGIVQPHWTTQLRETFKRSQAAVAEGFSTAGLPFIDGTAKHTKELFTELKPEPWSGGPTSLANVMNHLGETFKDDTSWLKFHDDLVELVPQDAAELIAHKVQKLERDDIIAGRSAKRVKGMTSILTKIRDDEKWAGAIAESIEGFVHRFEDVYLKKIEPNIVRPWALSHLAFAGFLPMAIVEDIGMAVVGMGVNPHRYNDRMFQIFSANLGIDAPPLQLMQAQTKANNIFKKSVGIYDADPKTPGILNKLTLGTFDTFVKTSSDITWGIQRGAWTGKFLKNFNKEMVNGGIEPEIVDAMMDVVKSEVPSGLSKDVLEDIQHKTWAAMTTGDPQAIKALHEVTNAPAMMQRMQHDVLNKFPEMPPDARRAWRRAVQKHGGITKANTKVVEDEVRKHLFDFLRYTPEGIRANFIPWVDAVGKVPPKSAGDALGQIRMLQHASDEIASLPREILAQAKHHSRAAAPEKRDAIWEEAFKAADESVAEVKEAYEEALKRANSPQLQKLIAEVDPLQQEAIKTNIDKIFDDYSKAASIDVGTRAEINQARELHFGVAGERDNSFFTEWDTISDEIWGRNRLARGELASEARKSWNGLFKQVNFHDKSVKEQRFLKMGIQSALGEVDGELSHLTNDAAEWAVALKFASPGIKASLEKRITAVNAQIIVKAAEKGDYEKQLANYGAAVSKTHKPSVLKEYDKDIGALKKVIKTAEATGIEDSAEHIADLARLQQERADVLRDIMPEHMRDEWNRLQSTLEGHVADEVTWQNNPNRLKAIASSKKKTVQTMSRLLKRVESGEGHDEAIKLTAGLATERQTIAKAILAANDGKVPETLERMGEIWNQGRVSGAVPKPSDELMASLGSESTRRDIYAEIVDASAPPEITMREQLLLRQAQATDDMVRDADLVGLIEKGFLGAPVKLANGKWKVEVTDKGLDEIKRIPASLDIDSAMASLPQYTREFENVVDYHMAQFDEVTKRMTDISDAPPISADQDVLIGKYFDRMSKELDRRPEFMTAAKNARQRAAKKTNELYNQSFVNYDNRTTGDFIMQRFMPFWMYESRRWPRLARLAAKRPVLAKHMTLIGGEWDYGYVPLPWGGMEFNPAKGTMAGGIKRAVARDFPEMHQGYRGKIEEGQDWFGRFGFYFSPPITTAINVLNGELAGNLPPPIASLLYLGASINGKLPAGLEELAFQSKFTNLLIDTAIADKLGKNPQDVRRAAEQGDEQAIADLYLGKREASRRIFVNIQSGTTRYRPPAKNDFQGSVSDAIEQFVGISIEDQEKMKRVGVPLYSVIPVSGFQRKAIREAIGEVEYDTWIGATLALRPVEEQRALRLVDDFWTAHERAQLAFEQSMTLLSSQWETLRISGPEARKRMRVLQAQRSATFDFLTSDPKYADGKVPITATQRIEWTKKFGNPPPLVHPVDEVLEAYYSINPDNYIDVSTSEVQWDLFFTARENVLASFPVEVSEVARKSLMKANTPMERSLKIAAPIIREYYGLRTIRLREIEKVNPEAAEAFKTYRMILNAQAFASDPREMAQIKQEAVILSARFPEIQMLNIIVRRERELLRQNNPEVASVYRTWINKPQ